MAETEILGKNIVGFTRSARGTKTYRGFDPRAAAALEPAFHEADLSEVDRALELADAAASELRTAGAARIAGLLTAISEEILSLGDVLVERAAAESGLDLDRLKGERARTTGQLKLFAEIVKEGSWVDARIDTPLPDRKPLPRPDLRRMLRPLGPVVVFGASNFPLAFSVAGGDTASALAAGNPVIVKAHPAHPGTSELVAGAILRAVQSQSMPEGTFSLLHGSSPDISLALVGHPKTKAVAFTGSTRAGRALFDAAARRPNPIPVFSEMGSVNPLFALPGALEERAPAIAEGLFRSVTLGVGQFCTNPGLVFAIDGAGFETFAKKLGELFEQAVPGTMLNPSIAKNYEERFGSAVAVKNIRALRGSREADPRHTEGRPGLLSTDAATWLANHTLHEEIFGPATLVVRCNSAQELLECSRALDGTLTATVHGTPEEIVQNHTLLEVLTQKAGRLLCNGFPTGVEVSYAMHHGGPYPATTDERFTSVGATAIYRFARPICYQNIPEAALPAELKNANPLGIWRMVDGALSRNPL
ncbi:MAG TPA: aldehyde dehydrogenase (NADP(+)) [Bryobacteraceae bacterium]|nr:aldehyde dehydrogenase (NADP(+)) [Bryobacteraceae bacterium]